MLSEFDIAGTTLCFPLDPHTGKVGLQIYPTGLRDQLASRRSGLAGLPFIDSMPDAGNPAAIVLDSLAQLKIVGDPCPPGGAHGHTMRNSASVNRFRYSNQKVSRDDEGTHIRTVLADELGCTLEHRLVWRSGEQAFHIEVEFSNGSTNPVTLEMLSSFSLSGISPFDSADAVGRLRVHRFRSGWSAEGRLETRSIEALHLERSWSGHAMFSERFGQIGSMPVRRWFPFLAVEDTAASVLWGVQLGWAGSWQMEIFRQHDDVCLSGGLADREFGHWTMTLEPGESLVSPPAVAACVHGTLDDLCERLTFPQHRTADKHPEIERDLPVTFNEWCSTWGNPKHEDVLAIADRLKGSGVRYLVIDAGWYKNGNGSWSDSHGDWMPSKELFPHGLEATAKAIRERGLVPGLWFEMETCGRASSAFSLVDHLLKRDGRPLTVGERRFWDMNDPFVVEYLTDHVVGLLDRGGFGYLKVDYNETIGIGCDDPASQGEGLRKQVLGIYRFFERIRERLPDLVIENCASGGHRLEPSMLARTAMSSFSDAHELPEIPIIAANLQRLVLPRQSQIWAVLKKSDTDQRLFYSLCATFLGRMCLSGEITELSSCQWALALKAQEIYRKAAPVIKSGCSRLHGEISESWRNPRGWQAVVRTNENHMLVVTHTFSGTPDTLEIPLQQGNWRITETFCEHPDRIEISNGFLIFQRATSWCGSAVLLERSFAASP